MVIDSAENWIGWPVEETNLPTNAQLDADNSSLLPDDVIARLLLEDH